MLAADAKKLYSEVKKGGTTYKEEVHCPMIFQVLGNDGTMNSFCKKVGICEGTFWGWCQSNPLFNQCYQIAKAVAKANWEEEGEKNKGNDEFDFDYWRIKGSNRYNYGKSKVRVDINAESNPFEQYKQLCRQAAMGDYSATELKLLMESINVGLRAYETPELKEQIDEMKNDVHQMSKNNGDDSGPVKRAKKASKNSV